MTPFLAIDIGNTSVKVALYEDESWGEVITYRSSLDAPIDAWRPRFEKLASERIACGVCSVVPALTSRLLPALSEIGVGEPFSVSYSGVLPFEMGYHTPETLGNDRIAAASAAWLLYGKTAQRPILSFDAGTAITLEAVDLGARGPVYLGGAILPGPHTLRRSLARDTAQLPDVEWERPEHVIGKSTTQAIQAGLTTLVLDGMEGLLSRSSSECSAPPLVVATGGWGGWLANRLSGVDHVAPHLVLDGIRLLAERAST